MKTVNIYYNGMSYLVEGTPENWEIYLNCRGTNILERLNIFELDYGLTNEVINALSKEFEGQEVFV